MDPSWKHKHSLTNSSKISDIVNYLKAQGIFDQFRHDCLADVDTKPSYQNLSQRVDGNAAKFLSNEEWNPDLNKNELRNKLRRHIEESGMVSSGVDHVVDQVVNPKIFQIFMPKIREIVQKQLALKQQKEEDARLGKDIKSIKPDPDAESATSRSRVYGIFSKTMNPGPDILHPESSNSDFLTKLTKSEISAPSKADLKITSEFKVRGSPDLQSPKQRVLNTEREKVGTAKASSIKVGSIKKEIDFEKESKFTNTGHSIAQLQKPLEKKKEKPANDAKMKNESHTPTKEKNPSSLPSVAKKNDANKHDDGKCREDANKHDDGKSKDDASKFSEGKSKDLKASDSKLTNESIQKKSEISKPVKLEKTEFSIEKLKDKKKEKPKEDIKTKNRSSSASSTIAPKEKSQDSCKSSSFSKHKLHDSQKYKSLDSDKSEQKQHKESHHHYHHDSQARDKHSIPDKNKSSFKDIADSKSRLLSKNKSSSGNESLKIKLKASISQEEKSKNSSVAETSGSSKGSYGSKDSPTKKLQTSSLHRERHEKSTHSFSSEKKLVISGDGKHESKHSTHSNQERKKYSEKSKSYHLHAEESNFNDSHFEKSKSLDSHSEKSKVFDSRSEKSQSFELHTEKDKTHRSHSEKSKLKESNVEKCKSHQSHNEKHRSHNSHQEKIKVHERSSDARKSEQQRSEISKSHDMSSERSKSQDSNSETNKTRDRINFKDLKFEKGKSKQTPIEKDVLSNRNLVEKSMKGNNKKSLIKTESTASSSSSSSSSQSSPHAAVSSKSSVDGFSDVETNSQKADFVKKEKTSCKVEKKHKTLSKPLFPPPEELHDIMQIPELDELSRTSYNETLFSPKEFKKQEESPVHNYQEALNVQSETYDDLAMLATSSPSEDEISLSDGEIKSVEDGSNSQQSKSFPLEQAALLVQKAGIIICSDELSVSEISSLNGSEQDNTESKDYKPRTRSKTLENENKSVSSNSQKQTTGKNSSLHRELSSPKSEVRSIRKTRSTSSSDSGNVAKKVTTSTLSSFKKDDENSIDDADDSSHSSTVPIEKREFRRQRKLNPKYASSDYASIFNSCKKGKTLSIVNNSSDEKVKEATKNDKEDADEEDNDSDSSSESSDSSSSDKDEESSMESENESHHSSQHSSESTKRKFNSNSTSSENEESDDSDVPVKPSRRTSKRLKTSEKPNQQTEDKIATKTAKVKSKHISDESSEEEQTEKRGSRRTSRMKAPPAKPNATKLSKVSINDPKVDKIIENRRRSSRDNSRSNDKSLLSIKQIEKASEIKKSRNASETQIPFSEKGRKKSKQQISVERSKNNDYYKTKKAQRYDSSDLYKPRPVIQSSTRRSRAHTPPL